MAPKTRWMWVWVNSGSWWWTGKPGVLQFMGSQRVGHGWATELNWTEACFRLGISIASVCVRVCAQLLSHVWLFQILWTVVHQAPLSMWFPRQDYWRGLPFPPPVDLPDPGIKLVSLMSPELADRFFTTTPPRKPLQLLVLHNKSPQNLMT